MPTRQKEKRTWRFSLSTLQACEIRDEIVDLRVRQFFLEARHHALARFLLQFAQIGFPERVEVALCIFYHDMERIFRRAGAVERMPFFSDDMHVEKIELATGF